MLPYYFLVKNHAAQVFFYSFFSAFLAKIGKNMAIFCNFSRCVSMIYEKVEKIIGQNT